MLQALWSGVWSILIYFVTLASGAILLRRFFSIPNEIFRKLLHLILLGSLLVWTLSFPHWWMAAGTALIFAASVYPLLMLAERWKGYSAFVTERSSGELKRSLLVVFVMYAAVAAVCWGLLDEKLLTLCSIYAWGFGDAAAALVGKRFGRHGLSGQHIQGRKSVEGSMAMFAVSFAAVLVLLVFRGGMRWYAYPVIAMIVAAISAAVELFTRNGMDTITCPLAAMAALLPLVNVFGGMA